jgi:hypothetical protein
MSGEIRVMSSLQVVKNGMTYRSQPTTFGASMNSAFNGPTPGALTVTSSGVKVDLSQLTAMGGVCRIMNYGSIDPDFTSTAFVTVGIMTDTGAFVPIIELLSGETYVLRLSRHLQTGGTSGTGTAGFNNLWMYSEISTCRVVVEAFDP